MKPIAIHQGEGWAVEWIRYCCEKGIPYIIVSGYDSDILKQLKGASGFLWHINHIVPVDMFMARDVLNAAEEMGLKVFPRFRSNWHYDNKIAQKYWFEANEIPAVESWVFYEKCRAFQFLEKARFPLVAKLRRGAGSYNVRLLKTAADARRYVKQMFGSGFSPVPRFLNDAKHKFNVALQQGGVRGVWNRLKKAPHYFDVMTKAKAGFPRERGYVYFQEFVPNNRSDIRVSVVGNRAWAFRRICREGDFRASGSGLFGFDTNLIPLDVIRASFDVVQKTQTEALSFDWVECPDGVWRFVETSCCFGVEPFIHVNGYWDRSLAWHEARLHPAHCILEDFLETIEPVSLVTARAS